MDWNPALSSQFPGKFACDLIRMQGSKKARPSKNVMQGGFGIETVLRIQIACTLRSLDICSVPRSGCNKCKSMHVRMKTISHKSMCHFCSSIHPFWQQFSKCPCSASMLHRLACLVCLHHFFVFCSCEWLVRESTCLALQTQQLGGKLLSGVGFCASCRFCLKVKQGDKLICNIAKQNLKPQR